MVMGLPEVAGGGFLSFSSISVKALLVGIMMLAGALVWMLLVDDADNMLGVIDYVDRIGCETTNTY